MGDSGFAVIEPSECIYLNPACIAHYKSYEVAMSAGTGAELEGQKASFLGVSFSDNKEGTIFPASFSYLRQRWQENEGQSSQDRQTYALSTARFLAPRLSLGLSYQYSHRASKDVAQGVHGGILYTPSPRLGLALVGHSVGKEPFYWGVGAYYLHTSRWRVSSDLSFFPETGSLDLGGGIETWLNNFVILRLGFKHSEMEQMGKWTTGFGLFLARFRLNYSYQQVRRSGDGLHAVDIKIPL